MKPINRRTFVQLASGSALAASLPAVAQTASQSETSEDVPWFDKPAAAWIAVVWQAARRQQSHAKEYLPGVRKAVLKQQDYHLADTLCRGCKANIRRLTNRWATCGCSSVMKARRNNTGAS